MLLVTKLSIVVLQASHFAAGVFISAFSALLAVLRYLQLKSSDLHF
jgi:hypothetical protein